MSFSDDSAGGGRGVPSHHSGTSITSRHHMGLVEADGLFSFMVRETKDIESPVGVQRRSSHEEVNRRNNHVMHLSDSIHSYSIPHRQLQSTSTTLILPNLLPCSIPRMSAPPRHRSRWRLQVIEAITNRSRGDLPRRQGCQR